MRSVEKVDVRERWGNRNGMGRHKSQEDQTKVRGQRRWARSESEASSEKRNQNTGTLGVSELGPRNRGSGVDDKVWCGERARQAKQGESDREGEANGE